MTYCSQYCELTAKMYPKTILTDFSSVQDIARIMATHRKECNFCRRTMYPCTRLDEFVTVLGNPIETIYWDPIMLSMFHHLDSCSICGEMMRCAKSEEFRSRN